MKFAAGLLLLAAVSAVSAQSDQYMAVFPKELRNGMDFTVELTLMKAAATVVCDVSVRSANDINSNLAWTDSEFSISIASGNTYGSNSLSVPYDVETGQQYFVFLSFTSGLTVKPVSESVVVTRPTSAIFIQTDRPRYKPGETVYYRVLNLDKYLKPELEVLTVQIKDPKENAIMLEKTDGSSGVNLALVSNNFTVSDDPLQGMYKIIAETATSYTEATFEVKEYVLPDFEVTVTLDRAYAVDGPDPRITGKVKALYSYGQLVNGKMNLILNSKFVKTENNFNGEMMFDIPVEKQTPEMLWTGIIYSRTLTVEAEVFEANTENFMSGTASFTMYPAEFAPTVVEPLPICFSGHTEYTFQVKLTNVIGGPLADWDVNQANSNDLSHYKLYYNVNSGTEKMLSMSYNPLNVTVTVDEISRYNTINMWFEYTGSNGKKVQSATVQAKPARYFSGSKSPITLELVSTSNQAERCFRLTPFAAGEKAFYQVVNNYYPEQLTPYTSTDKHCITLEHKHAPKSIIVAYKIVDFENADRNPQTELLTASVVIDHTWTSAQSVAVEIAPQQVKPGEEVDIVLKTTGQALVGISGVDKRTTFLAEANDITVKKLIEAVEQFRLFLRPKENPFPNPPIFGRGGPILFEDMAVKRRKKRCFACWDENEYMDPLKLLKQAGLTVITNVLVYQEQAFDYEDNCVFYEMAEALPPQEDDRVFDRTDEAESGAPDVTGDSDAGEEPKEVEQVREDFPETWLWEIETTETNGEKLIKRTVPDSITSWTVNAFAMNQAEGLGVAETQEVVVFQDFFISMDLPYSVVRTESFDLNILVFNYKDQQISVSVDLATSSNYTIMDMSKRVQTLNIKPGTSSAAVVPIQMNKIGDIPLRATATMTSDTTNKDIVIRELIVKPEGREIRKDANLKISMPVAAEEEFFFNISNFFNIPGYVPDSLRMYLHATGDMMGPFIENLEAKITMPFGCGEQNIKSLTPSVFVAKYLKTIDRMDNKVEAKVGRVCGAGYRKELIYKHQDGSYSAFGEGPNLCMCGSAGQKKGSTWLTAYVLKTFSLVYVDALTFVSPEILKESFYYLKNVSYPSCDEQYFVEEGELIHTEMQGGTSSRFGFTAFVLISIMDYLDAATKAGDAQAVTDAKVMIAGASQWTRDHKTELLNSNQPYQMAISAYALARAGEGPDAAAIELLEKVEMILSDAGRTQVPTNAGDCMAKAGYGEPRHCTRDSDCQTGGSDRFYYEPMQCCKVPCSGGIKVCSPKPYEYAYSRTGPTDVELNGYSLMAYLQLYTKTTDSAKKTMYKTKADAKKEWLLAMRKGDGFFYATQDTAVALEALARYAMTFPNTIGADFTLKALVNDAMASAPITVNSVNYIVNHEEKLSVTAPPSRVSVLVQSGNSGTAFLNLVALYNVNNNVTEDAYLIKIVTGTVNNEPVIRYTFKKNPDFTGTPGTMLVASVTLQSGLAFVDLKPPNDARLSPEKKEYDKETNTVNIYYMDSDDGYATDRTFDIVYKEEFEVNNRQPAVAVLRDYYKQENNVEMLYAANPTCLSNCNVGGASMLQVNMLMMLIAASMLLLARFV